MTSDAKRVLELLCGRVERDGRGLLRVVYLKEGTPNEVKARRALARMLKTSLPLDLGVRSVLADLIDPDCDTDRKIRFEHRRKGKPSNVVAEREIGEFIWSKREAGEQMKNVLSDASKKFGLKRARINNIWKRLQPILQRLKRRDLKGNRVNPFRSVQHNRD
jgi:hypothetical protein